MSGAVKQTLSHLQWYEYLLGLLFVLLITVIAFRVQQSDFLLLLSLLLPLFSIYSFCLLRPRHNSLYFWMSVGILSRFFLLFAFPNLSDDIYRFVWDGRLWQNGVNPFDHLPTYYIENEIALNGITPILYEQLNSPEYYTIYPPVAQLTFFIATWIAPNSVWWSAFVMKLFLFAFEVGSIFLILRLLQHWKLPKQRVLIYTLNPLLIIEIIGNLHFEGAMVFFLLLALWWLVQTKTIFSAGAFALSIAAKLLPLMFLPFLIRRLGWKQSLLYFTVVGLIVFGLFFPLFGAFFIENFGDSLNLYFQKFEFNASIYYLLRSIGYYIYGYNKIATFGPVLALIAGVAILLLSLLERSPTLEQLPLMFLLAISIYLSFTTTVHPWYLSLSLALCGFTRFRYPIVWSFLILLTYINYSYADYFENLWIVAIEYGVIWIWFLIELFKPNFLNVHRQL